MMAESSESFGLSCTAKFLQWLNQEVISIAFTTYQNGKLFILGLNPDGKLSVYERTFKRCMGLSIHEGGIYLASEYQVWHLENVLRKGHVINDIYDACYVPEVSYVTGAIDAHDIALDSKGKIVFVNTLFSCLATVSDKQSFDLIWQPPFIDELVPEDRCHLSGLAMVDGQPKYVTSIATTNTQEGWRRDRVDGGVIIDVETGEIFMLGLSMPHSPRYYQDKLWVLNSGTGYFGFIKEGLRSNRFVPMTLCPGYPRGLTFYKDYAIVGVSKPRDNSSFKDLPLDKTLTKNSIDPICGMVVINLHSGEIEHQLTLKGVAQELFDVAVLPGVRTPMLIGLQNDDIAHIVYFEDKLYQGSVS